MLVDLKALFAFVARYELNLCVGQAFGRQVGQHLMAEQMRVVIPDCIGSEFPRFKELVNYAKRSVLITGLGSVIIWMSFEFSYSRLDRDVWERVSRSTENQRVFVHESCSNFFLSSSAFALKESSSAAVQKPYFRQRLSTTPLNR